jgi:NADPH:quinone reductase-like Zn-dependent oxidoreductase
LIRPVGAGCATGVGLTAVEIGKAIGARVIAVAGDAEKLAVARSRGADELIDYREESIRDRVRALTGGKGADVVYDPVGGDARHRRLPPQQRDRQSCATALAVHPAATGAASGKFPTMTVLASGSHETPRWRKTDSNSRSR